MPIITFFLKSRYRFLIFGLYLALVLLWAYWLRTDQLITPQLLVYITGVTLLNTVLAYFSATRHHYTTIFFIGFSYGLIGLTAYTIYYLGRGIF